MELLMENELYNLDAEQTILGSAIINNAVLLRVADFVEEKHFYFEENKAVFRRFVEVSTDSRADHITLKDYFKNNEVFNPVGGVAYLSQLLAKATGVVDIRDYGYLLVELWQKRQLTELLENAMREIGSKSFNSISANLENELIGLAIREPKKKTQTMAQIIKDIEEEDRQGLSTRFTPTGFRQLDELLNGGIYSQQLVILGARPSVGKTTMGQNIILNASFKNKRCLFISLEVDKRNVYYKFVSNLASIDGWKLQKNILNEDEKISLARAKKQLSEMEICVNDSSYLRVSQIKQFVKTQMERQPIDLVVVDYVQIIRGDDTKGRNEATIIKETTSALKAMAKQYDFGILALAQINRKAVEGANQEPTINDFKSSGGIEEDADVAIILHRDRNEKKKESYFSNSGKLIVAKNRHGRTGEVMVDFYGQFGRFQETGGL
jgi:replicative DNA helicase